VPLVVDSEEIETKSNQRKRTRPVTADSNHLTRGPVDDSHDNTVLTGYIDQIIGTEPQRRWRREWPKINIAHMDALHQINDADEISRIWIAAMDSITEDRHIGKSLLRHDKWLMQPRVENRRV
jgi:hypothetical protein